VPQKRTKNTPSLGNIQHQDGQRDSGLAGLLESGADEPEAERALGVAEFAFLLSLVFNIKALINSFFRRNDAITISP